MERSRSGRWQSLQRRQCRYAYVWKVRHFGDSPAHVVLKSTHARPALLYPVLLEILEARLLCFGCADDDDLSEARQPIFFGESVFLLSALHSPA